MSLDMALLFISYVPTLIIGFSMIAYKIRNAPIGPSSPSHLYAHHTRVLREQQ